MDRNGATERTERTERATERSTERAQSHSVERGAALHGAGDGALRDTHHGALSTGPGSAPYGPGPAAEWWTAPDGTVRRRGTERLFTVEIAAVLGIKPGTWGKYVEKGFAPSCDGHVGRRPWWWDTTFAAYLADPRRGQGTRTDLAPAEQAPNLPVATPADGHILLWN